MKPRTTCSRRSQPRPSPFIVGIAAVARCVRSWFIRRRWQRRQYERHRRRERCLRDGRRRGNERRGGNIGHHWRCRDGGHRRGGSSGWSGWRERRPWRRSRWFWRCWWGRTRRGRRRGSVGGNRRFVRRRRLDGHGRYVQWSHRRCVRADYRLHGARRRLRSGGRHAQHRRRRSRHGQGRHLPPRRREVRPGRRHASDHRLGQRPHEHRRYLAELPFARRDVRIRRRCARTDGGDRRADERRDRLRPALGQRSGRAATAARSTRPRSVRPDIRWAAAARSPSEATRASRPRSSSRRTATSRT